MTENSNRLFQRTVFKQFIATQDHEAIRAAYEKFSAHFGDPKVQERLKVIKEEQYQEGFLNDLLVNVLDYTLFPKENHTVITEFKNTNNAGKADAAIIFSEQVWAVIEIKSHNNTDNLKHVERQAFSYKVQHPNCRYVLTTNLQYLRFYLDNAVQYEVFDLFNLSYEDFAALYTILHRTNLENGLPIEIKRQSLVKEQEITLAFYEDYQSFKEILFLNIAQFNKQFDKYLLFEKTQKLLDRVVFMCFASDKRLLPLNLIASIIEEWQFVNDIGLKISLYDRFKQHFQFINAGFRSRRYDIYGYNGGLFAPDEVLDSIRISDELLQNRSEKLSRYDFENEIDINILGHIFEHSLNELERKRRELMEDLESIEAGSEPKNLGKRKIDGIFYTPNYITHYIVEETVGRLCHEKRHEWILETAPQIENVLAYENWLRTLRILDPACGSGAFLNQVLSFMIEEYTWLDQLKTAVLPKTEEPKNGKNGKNGNGNDYDIFSAPEPIPQKKPKLRIHEILENNIFGVDLNSESVSITKLSLWLKTAQHRQRLNDLAENIKIGNSLIDDSEIDPKAFDWEKEFPSVFENPENQGFTIIVGNPPYVSANNMSFKQRQYFNQSAQYQHLQGKWDLFMPFFEKGFSLLQNQGILSFIVPYGLLNQPFSSSLRKWILEDFSLRTIVDLHEVKVFEEATVPTCIPVIYKAKNLFEEVRIVKHRLEGEKHIFYESHRIGLDKYRRMEGYRFRTEKLEESFDLLEKIKTQNVPLGEYFYVSTGAEIHGKESRDESGILTSGYSRTEIIEQEQKYGFKPFLEGSAIPKSRQLGRYCSPQTSYYLDYEGNFDRMRSPKFKELFENPKIMIRKVSGLMGILATFDEGKFYTSEGMILVTDFQTVREQKNIDLNSPYPLKVLLALLNSQAMHFYYKSVYGGFVNVFPNYIKSLPIPAEISKEIQAQIIEKTEILLLAHQNLAVLQRNFIKVLKSQFGLKKSSERLELWYNLEWETFTQEMQKLKNPIPTKKEFEWIGIFEEKRQEALGHLNHIEAVDKLLDKMIFALYGLTDSEINMVENG